MNLKSNITDIFFDLDHTLWDFEKNSALAFGRVFEKNKIEVELSVFLEAYSPINEKYWDKYRYGEILQEELRLGRLHDTFGSLKIKVSKQAVHRLSEDYIRHLPENNHLFPGVIEALDYLREKYSLHIITDGFEEVQWKKMRKSNIDAYFKTVTTSEEAGAKKPSPLIFGHALKKANCDKTQALMVGDNLQADVLGAIGHGMQAVYFSQNKNHDGMTVASHLKLMELL